MVQTPRYDAYIAVGANLSPLESVPAALEMLRRRVTVTGCSTFRWTEPIGPPGQPTFLNGVWSIRTGLSAENLKEGPLREIELQLGRVRSEGKYAPRVIDLDLVIHDEAVIDRAELARDFVAAGVAELAGQEDLPPEARALVSKRANAAAGDAAEELTRQMKESLAR